MPAFLVLYQARIQPSMTVFPKRSSPTIERVDDWKTKKVGDVEIRTRGRFLSLLDLTSTQDHPGAQFMQLFCFLLFCIFCKVLFFFFFFFGKFFVFSWAIFRSLLAWSLSFINLFALSLRLGLWMYHYSYCDKHLFHWN